MAVDETKAEEAEKAASSQPEKSAEETSASAAANYYDQLLRLKAEFENYRKRVDREKPELVRFGRADMLLKLLPIYDMLQLAHERIQADHAQTELAKGMEGIFKEFQKLFKEEGVVAMEPLDKPYDALKHEVLGTEPAGEREDGTVVAVLQNGFMIADKVLRTAKVRIAKKEA